MFHRGLVAVLGITRQELFLSCCLGVPLQASRSAPSRDTAEGRKGPGRAMQHCCWSSSGVASEVFVPLCTRDRLLCSCNTLCQQPCAGGCSPVSHEIFFRMYLQGLIHFPANRSNSIPLLGSFLLQQDLKVSAKIRA